MSLMFVKVDDCDLEQYKKDMQEAFQKDYLHRIKRLMRCLLNEKTEQRADFDASFTAY